MNSRAMVRVPAPGTWMERTLGVRGARLLLTAGGMIGVGLAVPGPLLDQLVATAGLSGASDLFVAPVGLTGRMVLTGAFALVPVLAVWIIWRTPGSGPAQDMQGRSGDDIGLPEEDENEMMNARVQSSISPWDAFKRFVRGGAQPAAVRDDVPLRKRRRRDRHPDAPPRPPLFASRDLPPPDLIDPQESPAPKSDPIAAPVPADAVRFAAPAPRILAPAPADLPSAPPAPAAPDIALPRSPAPLSDAEIATAVATLPPLAARPAPAPQADRASSWKIADLGLPLIENADLGTLAVRFEQGVARREAIVNARQAQHALGKHLPSAAVAAPPQGEVFAAADAPGLSSLRVESDVESALNDALATLRQLAGARRA